MAAQQLLLLLGALEKVSAARVERESVCLRDGDGAKGYGGHFLPPAYEQDVLLPPGFLVTGVASARMGSEAGSRDGHAWDSVLLQYHRGREKNPIPAVASRRGEGSCCSPLIFAFPIPGSFSAKQQKPQVQQGRPPAPLLPGEACGENQLPSSHSWGELSRWICAGRSSACVLG